MVIFFEFFAAALFFFSLLNQTSCRLFILYLCLSMFLLLVLPTSSQLVYSNISILNNLAADYFSFWFSYLVIVVILSSVLVVVSSNGNNSLSALIFFFLFLSCYLVFCSSDMLTLYLAYEFSLVPILFIIVNDGNYPDRSLSAMYIFVYTAFFSFPFIVYVIWSMCDIGSASFFLFGHLIWGFNPYLISFAFSVFIVNLPIYGFHFWLPIAHVEAPTYGSIILAGLLLNIGGCGLMRLSVFSNFGFMNSLWLSFITLSLVLSSAICCVQSDFNRLVAYSSVSHIIVVVLAVLIGSYLGLDSFIMVMLTHGLSSPMLFLLVGVSYRLFSSRMLVLSRGLLISFPLISVFFILCFVLSVPVPPSLSFLAEVQFATSLVSYSITISLFVGIFIFIGVLYNLFWLSSLFGPQSIYSYNLYTFSSHARELLSLFFISVFSLILIVNFV